MIRGDAFNRGEVSSVYVGPDHRFVVSLIVGAEDGQSAKEAAEAVLNMTRCPNRGHTVWIVHDRHTGETKEFMQAEFDTGAGPAANGG